MTRALQNPRFKLRGEHRGHLAYMSAVKAGDTLLSESLAPAGHKAPTTLDPLGGFIPRMPIGQQQNQPCSSGIFRPIRPAARSRVSSIRSTFVKVMASVIDTIIVYK